MVTRRAPAPQSEPNRRRPATTPEARENQLVAKAVDLAERQLEDGTASAQVISHFLKLGSSRERLEQERLAYENELTKTKIDALEAQARVEDLITNALNAMRSYTGNSSPGEPVEYED